MKKVLTIITIILAIFSKSQGQDKLKIGEVKADKLIITEMEALKGYLLNSLDHSGSFGKDYKVSNPPEADRFLVYFPVFDNRDNVSCKGIMLVRVKNEAFIMASPPRNIESAPGGGGSFEITCTGSNCSTCVPDITWGGGWLPIVYCDCKDDDGGNCNMSSKLVIQVTF